MSDLIKITDQNIPEGEGDFVVICQNGKDKDIYIGSIFMIESNYYGVAFGLESQLNATHYIKKDIVINILNGINNE